MDGLFKNSVRQFTSSDRASYKKFMSTSQIITGIVTCVLGLITIRQTSLLTSLLLTPIITGIVSAPFLLHRDVYSGLFMSVISKASKYIFFDSSKELIYLYLPPADKNKVKSSIDIVMNRVGKSSSSLLETSLIYLFDSWDGASRVMSLIFYSSIMVWIWSGLNLNNVVSHMKG